MGMMPVDVLNNQPRIAGKKCENLMFIGPCIIAIVEE